MKIKQQKMSSTPSKGVKKKIITLILILKVAFAV